MSVEEVCSFRKESLVPQIDESNEDGEAPKSKLITILDDIESRVERFRRGALLMEEEKDLLFSSIDAVRNSELLNDLVESEYHSLCTPFPTVSLNTLYFQTRKKKSCTTPKEFHPDVEPSKLMSEPFETICKKKVSTK